MKEEHRSRFQAHLEAELVHNVAQDFPDQGNWLPRLSQESGCSTLAALIRHIGYDGRPPELLTMHLCMFMGAAWPGFDIDAAAAFVESHAAEHGDYPSPKRLAALMASAKQ